MVQIRENYAYFSLTTSRMEQCDDGLELGPALIFTTVNFTDKFRNVSVMLRAGDWLAGRRGRGRHTLSIEKHT